MNSRFWSGKKRLKKWGLRAVLVGIALLIIIFNDAIGDSETFGVVSFLYFILLGFLLLRWIFKQIKSIIKLKNEKAKTELQHLKSQVNPHFFFNTLNNLYGLVGKDPKKAQDLILKLSDMMRYSIYEGEKTSVTLEEEVVYLKNYMALHEMRYHKAIDLKVHENVEIQNLRIMPLLFILLLENAFKHGVENLRENAFVHVELVATEKDIRFTVTNNFEVPDKVEHAGIGLSNLKRRLELAYPNKHTLSLEKEGDIYKAQLSLIPL